MNAAAQPPADDATERLINLTFAFLGAERAGRPYLSGHWLRSKVAGYSGITEEAARKRLQRDLRALARAGVPLEATRRDGEQVYRIRGADYELPPIEFTPEEATVVALAGRLGGSGQLAAFTRSGWTKLAASGLPRTPTQATAAALDSASSYDDLTRISARTLKVLLTAIRDQQRITFSHRRSGIDEPTSRTMDPWRIVMRGGNAYLVGYDIDREEPRSFRLTRTSAHALAGPATHHATEAGLGNPPDFDQIVTASLTRARHTVDATVVCAPARGLDIRAAGTATASDPNRIALSGVDRDWLVRTCAGLGPDAVILDPPDARAAVRALPEASLNTEDSHDHE